MEWMLLILAVSINNSTDIPARVTIEFQDEKTCLNSLNTLKYWVKYESYKVKAECQKKQY